MQIYADVLNERIALAESDQSVALGAAILGCLAAGEQATGYASVSQAIHAMARQREDLLYRPDLRNRKRYAELYPLYRGLAEANGSVAQVMRRLRELSHAPPADAASAEPHDADLRAGLSDHSGVDDDDQGDGA